MRIRKGDICFVNLTGAFGHEQSGVRPAVVLALTKTSIAIVIPLTTNFDALRFAHTLTIEATKQNGLTKDSAALLFHIRAIDSKRIEQKCGHVEAAVQRDIDDGLRELLGL